MSREICQKAPDKSRLDTIQRATQSFTRPLVHLGYEGGTTIDAPETHPDIYQQTVKILDSRCKLRGKTIFTWGLTSDGNSDGNYADASWKGRGASKESLACLKSSKTDAYLKSQFGKELAGCAIAVRDAMVEAIKESAKEPSRQKSVADELDVTSILKSPKKILGLFLAGLLTGLGFHWAGKTDRLPGALQTFYNWMRDKIRNWRNPPPPPPPSPPPTNSNPENEPEPKPPRVIGRWDVDGKRVDDTDRKPYGRLEPYGYEPVTVFEPVHPMESAPMSDPSTEPSNPVVGRWLAEHSPSANQVGWFVAGALATVATVAAFLCPFDGPIGETATASFALYAFGKASSSN